MRKIKAMGFDDDDDDGVPFVGKDAKGRKDPLLCLSERSVVNKSHVRKEKKKCFCIYTCM